MDLTLLPLLLLATPSTPNPLHTYAALTGRPSYTDALLLCLSMQTPLTPTALNEGEYPACAAMTTGYVFRVENQATVMYLRRVGRTGCLTTLDVSLSIGGGGGGGGAVVGVRSPVVVSKSSSISASMSVSRSLSVSVSRWAIYAPSILLAHTLLFTPFDPFLLLTVCLLLLSRALSIATLRARTSPAGRWHGEREPGVRGDLLVLLSEDRWVRMRGLVDDLKAVTSGSWLSVPQRTDLDDPSATSNANATVMLLDALDWLSRLFIPLAAVVLPSARDSSKLTLTACLLLGHVLLVFRNAVSDTDAGTGLLMNGRRVVLAPGSPPGKVKRYPRRLAMAEELVAEVGRRDWAVKLGMVNTEPGGKEEDVVKRNRGDDADENDKTTHVVDEVVTM